MRRSLLRYVLTSLSLLILLTMFVPTRRSHAQSGCSLRINEVMYDPASGKTGPAAAEWVELYVATEISTPTTFYISDQESGSTFAKTFFLPVPSLNPVPLGTYIVVHNDGNTADDGSITHPNGFTAIHFYIGNSAVHLSNTGDDLVLQQNNIDCDYIAFGSGSSIDNPPAGLVWISSGPGASTPGSCPNPSAQRGYSISLASNGALSDNSCDWVESGYRDTGAPHTQGAHNNALGVTAIALRSLTAYSRHRLGRRFLGVMLLVLGMLVGVVGRKVW